MAGVAAQLDALAELGERKQVEQIGERYLGAAYLKPFALRALGIVREDSGQIERAATCFEALNLRWHAAQTWKRLTG
jgi:hypothetical protein